MKLRQKLEKAKRFLLEEIWQFELSQLSRLKAFLYNQLRIIYIVGKGFIDDRCLLRASALTYITLFGLVPLLAVAFSISQALKFDDKYLKPLIMDKLTGGMGVIASKILEYIENINAANLGLMGIAILFLSVIGVLGNIEKSFNDIWGVKKARTFFRRFSDYLSVLVVGPVLVAAALGATASLQSRVLSTKLAFISRPFLQMSPFILLWIALTFIYFFMPNTKVRLVSALAGGIIAGTFWQLAQWLYVHFQVRMTAYQAIYGTFASAPIFLFWIYLSWIIVLFGAELSFAHQNVKTYTMERKAISVSYSFKEALALRIALAIGENFYWSKEPWSAQRLAEAWNVPVRLIREILFQLIQSQIITEVGDGYYQPAKALEKIPMKSILDAMRNYGGYPVNMEEKRSLDELLTRINQATERELDQLSLKDLIQEGS